MVEFSTCLRVFFQYLHLVKCSIHRTVTPSLQKKIKNYTIYFVYFSEAVLATVTTRNIKAFALKKKHALIHSLKVKVITCT